MRLPEWSEVVAQKNAEIEKMRDENRRLREELAEARRMADIERGRA